MSDFGLSRVVNTLEDDYAKGTVDNTGPLKWMAPEALSKRKYSKKTVCIFLIKISLIKLCRFFFPHHFGYLKTSERMILIG